MIGKCCMYFGKCTLYFVYDLLLMDQVRKQFFFSLFWILCFLEQFYNPRHTCFTCKTLSNVISLFKMDYVSYFNKLLGPCAATFRIIFGLLKALLLYNLSEWALLIYCSIYLTKGILIMFQRVMHRLQEYLWKILLTITVFIQARHTFIFLLN